MNFATNGVVTSDGKFFAVGGYDFPSYATHGHSTIIEPGSKE
jgi:hypothetical protein